MDRHSSYTASQLIKLYWQSNQRRFAYLFLFAAVAMTMIIVALEVTVNNWYNAFYTALQEYDKHSVKDLIIIFIYLATIFILFTVYRYYVNQFLGLRWRRWLTHYFLSRWLQQKNYYYLENFAANTDNPDQRIQEDVGALVSYSLDLSIGLISAVTTIIAFIAILWVLSGQMIIPLGRFGSLSIPGYLVWICLLYAVVGTYLSFRIGRPLVGLNFEQQRREANFRFAAVDLRTHSENIALYRGENQQKKFLLGRVEHFLENWYQIILRQKLLLWFTAGYNQVSIILPLILALPNYLNRAFKLGGLMQTISAFRQVQDALSFVVNAFTTLALWRAVVQRLLTFLNHMQEIENAAIEKNRFSYTYHEENKILLQDLTIETPDSRLLLSHINQEWIHGHHYLMTGSSGIGKSTCMRVIAGIWPYGIGKIILPRNKKILYIPQKMYMPIGTLKESLLFPDDSHSISDALLLNYLKACDLPHLMESLYQTATWSEQLSPGEQQRIAFVRILLQKPDWVFLDESTSSLDLPHEKSLYELLKKELPHCSLVSIGHRASLEDFHDRRVDISLFTPSFSE